MSKPNSNIPPSRDASPARVPSFDALRTDDDERSDLRRNQTIPMPIGLRQELASRELPKVPPEQLRSTDDLDEALKSMRHRRDRNVLMLVGVAILAAATSGVVYVKLRQPAAATGATPVTPTNTVVSVPSVPVAKSMPPEIASAIPSSEEVHIAAPTLPPRTFNHPQNPSKPAAQKSLIGKTSTGKGSDAELDPNEMIYNPK